MCLGRDQQAGQRTEWPVPFLGLEPSDLLWFFKIILLLPPLVLDQTEARRAEKKFVWGPPPPPPYLKVLIRHYLPICESLSA